MKKISFGFLLFLPLVLFSATDIAFYSSLDTQRSVLSPEIGKQGIAARELVFTEGVKGRALLVKNGGGTAGFLLPNGLPADKGLIEFYAKINNSRSWYQPAGDPTFFSVFDAAETNKMVMAFEINANNGIAKSGWYFRFNHLGWVTSLPHFGWHLDYKTCFADGNSKTWHHYAIQWNMSGISGSDDIARVYLDGDQILAMNSSFDTVNTESESLKRYRMLMTSPLILFFAREFHEEGQNHTDYEIDEFKIWTTDSLKVIESRKSFEKKVYKFTNGPVLAAEKVLKEKAAKEAKWFLGTPLVDDALPYIKDISIEVSGLPDGVKFNNKERKFTGIPKKIGQFYIQIKITREGKVSVLKKKVTVETLPDWAYGIFAGGSKDNSVLFIIDKDGLLAGRITTLEGKWTIDAYNYAEVDLNKGVCKVKAKKTRNKKVLDILLTITPNGVYANEFDAHKIEWDSNEEWRSEAELLEGKTCHLTEDGNDFVFNIGKNAQVDAICTIKGERYNVSTILIPFYKEALQYKVFVCIPKNDTGFPGYSGEFVFDGENLVE